MHLSERKESIRRASQKYAKERINWKKKNSFFHSQDQKYLSFLIPENASILDLGCGVGDLLAQLKPTRGVGIDISELMLEEAKNLYPEYEFIHGDIEDSDTLNNIEGTFDYIILSDTMGYMDDCQSTLESLHNLCNRETRIIVSHYSYVWEPFLKVAEFFKLKMPQSEMNFLATDDIINLMELADFNVTKKEHKQLLPLSLFGIGHFINSYFASLPFIRRLCIRHYIVTRSMKKISDSIKSCSIVIPCKNEKGNIEEAIKRIPQFCDDIEIIYVEGHSEDGTLDEINRVKSTYTQHNIKVLIQDGTGKADAVYKAFDHATSDVLMILDADLTMPPEELGKFWHAIQSGQGEYINGSRLVYPMEKEAMRFLNLIANRIFSKLFSWLLNQRYTDTLCGTKVLRKKDYLKIKENRSYFGDFDPFGDFDLIFGSSKLNLKMVEIPITYRARSYGDTQISRFRHGWLLIKMVVYGFKKLKAI